MLRYGLKMASDAPSMKRPLSRGKRQRLFSGGLVILVAVGIGRCVGSSVVAFAMMIGLTAGILRA